MTLRRRLSCRFSKVLPWNVVQAVNNGMLFSGLLIGSLLCWPHYAQAQVNMAPMPSPVEGEYALVALRVEFQPDNNPFTSGNGTFGPGSIPYLEELTTNIDPLPHDAGYVKSHLDFAATYFAKQSAGRVSIKTFVLPEVVRVSKPMEAYSPVGENPTNEPIAELTHEAWLLSGALGSHQSTLQSILAQGIAPEKIIFVMVHAGIGRDIELTGTTLEKTPQDLPSVFLDQQALVDLEASPNGGGFGGVGFRGAISTGVPGLEVTHGMLIPRTQTRKGFYINNEPFLVPLSINGMLSAQIGSFFGLPDLFNTQSGESGIGRFGLMDGAGIFAVAGLFPPNMSAWEKQWLGWVEPQSVAEEDFSSFGLASVSLAAAREGLEGDVLRLETLAADYFLIENRHRNPSGELIKLTFRMPNGSEEVITRTATDSLFSIQVEGFDQSLPKGVLVDVSHYDVALPGGLDVGEDQEEGTDDDRALLGGVLIWHVQPGKIAAALAQGKGINDDPDSRGVDLEEADGAQDIGFQTQVGVTIFDATGSAFDFWWNGNDARVVRPGGQDIQLYANRFDASTLPSNHTALGAPTWFELSDFSDVQPVATFSLRKVTETQDQAWIQRLFVSSTHDPLPHNDGQFNHKMALFDLAPFDLASWESSSWSFAWFATTNALWELQWPKTTGSYGSGSVQLQKVADGSFGAPLFDGERLLVGRLKDDETVIMAFECSETAGCSDGQTVATPLWETTLSNQPTPNLIASLRRADEHTIAALYSTWRVDTRTGESLVTLGQPFLENRIDGYRAKWTGSTIDLQTPSGAGSIPTSKDLMRLLEPLYSNDTSLEQGFQAPSLHWIERRRADGERLGFDLILSAEGQVRWIDLTKPVSQWVATPLTNHGELPTSITAWMDVDQDHSLDWVYPQSGESTWAAVNLEGGLANGFPWSSQDPLLEGTRWINRPLGFRLKNVPEEDATGNTATSSTDILALPHTLNGSIALYPVAITPSPTTLRPISLGSSPNSINDTKHSLKLAFVGDELVSVSPSGEVVLYRLPADAEVTLGQSITPWAGFGTASTLLDGSTTIEPKERLLHVDEVYNWPNPANEETVIRAMTSSAATIQVHVITMAGVTRFKGEFSSFGVAPAELTIDTSNWSSGVYVVRVTARSTDGSSKDQHQFNLAIIR